MKKINLIWIIGIMLIVSSSVVFADITKLNNWAGIYGNTTLIIYPSVNSSHDNKTGLEGIPRTDVGYTGNPNIIKSNYKNGEGSLYFNGTNSYKYGTTGNLPPTLDGMWNTTIIFWLNRTELTSTIPIARVDLTAGADTGEWRFFIDTTTPLVRIIGNCNPAISVSATWNPSTLSSSWEMLTGVITFNGSMHLNLFRNKTQVAQNNISCALNSASITPISLGHELSGGVANAYKGGLDDIIIINRSLTQDEISLMYNITNSQEFTYPKSEITFNASEFFTGQAINTFRTDLYYNNSFLANISTINNQINFNLSMGNYTALFTSSNYSTTNISFVLSELSVATYTFTPYDINTLNLTVYQEGTSTLIQPNPITIKFDSSVYVYNTSTITGKKYIGNLTSSTTYTLTLSSSSYTTRIYPVTFGTNTHIDLNAYLVNSTGLTAVTFVVKDQTTTQTIDAATIAIYDKIGTTYVLITQQNTNAIGEVIISLDTTKTYRIVTSKSGYTTDTSDFTYTSTPYTINLLSTSSVVSISTYSGITSSYLPTSLSLVNNTRYNFTYNMSVLANWVITSCVFNLKNSTTNFIQSNAFYNSSQCNATIEIGTGTNSTIISSFTYTLNSTHNDTFPEITYSIKYYYQGQFSLKTVLDDIKSFTGAGFNDISRMIIGFIIIFAITASVAKKSSFIDPDYLIILFIILTFAISYIGWFKINDYAGLTSDFLKQYIISISVLLTGAGLIINRNFE